MKIPKWRGLTKDDKWVYGWYAKVEGKHFIITENAGLRYHECPDGIHGIEEVIPETVGQYLYKEKQ